MRVAALSFACNNACVFCAQGKLREKAASSSADAAVKQVIESLVVGETVALVGGEPTLLDELPSLVRALDGAGAGRILVQTNGRRLAYRSYARGLREASARLTLEVSIAGSTEAMHDYHTGAEGSFKQTVVGLRNARAERIGVSVSCVVTRSNFRHLTEIVRLCHAVGAKAVRFVPAQPVGTALALRGRVVPAPEMVAPYLALALNEANKLGMVARAAATGDPDEGETFAFAGLGPVESPAQTTSDSPASRRALAIFGRPAPGRREERGSSRRSGDELRTILPSLFDGSPPKDVADLVAGAAPPSAGTS